MIRTRMAIFIALAMALSACLRSATARELSIEHVTVVSTERSGPLRDATVVVRDERIASVTASGSPRASGRGVVVIDGTGLFLSPGLIDSHVHTNELAGMQGMEGRFPVVARALRDQLPRGYLYFGFTTLVDVISTPEHLREWKAWIRRASIRVSTCGCWPARS
jgi:predicted amidohydrolase